MLPGIDFRAQLRASLDACQVFLCVMGDQWTGPTGLEKRRIDDPDDMVRIEIEIALGRDIIIIPILARDFQMPKADFFPDSIQKLAYRHFLRLRSVDPDFQDDLSRIVTTITAHLKKSEQPDDRVPKSK